MATSQDVSRLNPTQDQIKAMSEDALRQILAEQQGWAQDRFPNDAYKPGQPEKKPQGKVSFANVTDPLVIKLREFAGWSPEHTQKVHQNDLARLVHSNGQVIDAITTFDARSNKTAPTPVKAPVEELGKVDGAGGQMTPAALEAVKKQNEAMEAAAKAGKNESPQEMLKRHAAEDAAKKSAAPAAKTDTAAAPGAMTPKEVAKTQADFAAETKAAEIRQTQGLLHMFGVYDVPDGSKAAAIDGKSGYATRRALDNFAAQVQRTDPSLRFNSYEEIAAQLRVEALANREAWQGTAENMKTSPDSFTRSVGEQVSAFLKNPGNVPADRHAVLGSGITRTVTGRYQEPTSAPVAAAATSAAATPGQEGAFEDRTWGFNDQSVVATRPSREFSTAARGNNPPAQAQTAQAQVEIPQAAPPPIDLVSRQDARREQPVPNAAADTRAADVVEALGRAPDDITRTNLGELLTMSYKHYLEEGKISAGEPVLFEGDRKGRLFVAYGGQNGRDVTVKNVTKFYDSRLGTNPLARDIASLAQEGRGGLVDNISVPTAYAAAVDRVRQWQEQREQQRQQQLAQQQQGYSSAPPPSGWGRPRGGYDPGPPPGSYDRGPPPDWRGGNPGVSFRGDRGPPPGWPGGHHHHGHGGRSFSLDNPGGLLRSIFGGASSTSQVPEPIGVVANLLDSTSAHWTNHGNRFNLN